ncbi:MAG: class I SAM-dependent methyltransferase [Verrucomicrobiales bacterium]|nr:class I SAM-dependent methyltransferase [Verrucomicrobiales bacterium]
MKERLVIPEILDSLPDDDPEAIRSRRDLRLVNGFMGNYRWVARQIRETPEDLVSEWVEVGAGDGHLVSMFSEEEVERLSVTGLDFISRPGNWPSRWGWRQSDVFDGLGENPSRDRGIIANLFLHHFEPEDLRRLGDVIDRECSRLVFSEPARYPFFRFASCFFDPFVNRVTRYDMRVSIGAGFRKGELPTSLGLGDEWEIRDSTSILGAYRLEAWRRVEKKSPS